MMQRLFILGVLLARIATKPYASQREKWVRPPLTEVNAGASHGFHL
jgi:hypothetical protein